MRLLHTSELGLTDFIANPPPYAILSHTWAEDEVLFADLQGDPKVKTGWAKVTGTCRVAKHLGYEWIWIDTCCIDKSSSAELSEAINSMFRWYQKSGICLAYLADVYISKDNPRITGALKRSRWFTRGWTLQELLAPTDMIFYASKWDSIGLRHDLAEHIAEATGIHTKYIGLKPSLSSSLILEASVAERMSWASHRKTTRIEDIAYCLLGIFDVNMPLIYGEGLNAYKMLQECIMQETDDQAIFAWGELRGISNLLPTKTWCSFLPDHPMAFRNSANIIPFETPYIKTRIGVDHNGVTIESPIWEANQQPFETHDSKNRCLLLAPLLCQYQDDPLNCIALMLTCDRNRKPVRNYNSSAMSCYRLTDGVFPAPKRIWIPGRLFQAFLPYKLSLGTGKSSTRDRCIIRTLPCSYQARPSLDHISESRFAETSSRRSFSVDLGTQHHPSFWGETFHLGMLHMIPLQRKPRQDITIILQILYFHTKDSTRSSLRHFPDSKYLIYRVANGRLDGSVIENGLQDESQRLGMSLEFETDRRANSAGIEMSFDRFYVELRPPGSGNSTDHASIEDIRVTVCRDSEFDPNLFILDIEDGGSSVSAEATIEGYFEPLH